MPDKELVDYFISHTNERFKVIDDKLESLLSFKWQLIGASVAVTVLIDVAFLIFQGGK
jgi:hypothetical protein